VWEEITFYCSSVDFIPAVVTAGTTTRSAGTGGTLQSQTGLVNRVLQIGSVLNHYEFELRGWPKILNSMHSTVRALLEHVEQHELSQFA
jgi:hypothetical protein